jgi:hypothetical protein
MHDGDTGDVRISMVSANTHIDNPQQISNKLQSASTQNVKPMSKTFGLKGKSIGMMEHSVFNSLKTQNLYTYRKNNP